MANDHRRDTDSKIPSLLKFLLRCSSWRCSNANRKDLFLEVSVPLVPSLEHHQIFFSIFIFFDLLLLSIKMKYTIVAVAGFATVANAFSNSAFNGKTTIAGVPKSTSALDMRYKVAVVGGGPSGACAAEIFAQEKGIDTVLFERKLDNAKPCGGAIPLCMVGEFDIPETVVDRKVRSKCIWTFPICCSHGLQCRSTQ